MHITVLIIVKSDHVDAAKLRLEGILANRERFPNGVTRLADNEWTGGLDAVTVNAEFETELQQSRVQEIINTSFENSNVNYFWIIYRFQNGAQ